jgi:adenylate cyclase
MQKTYYRGLPLQPLGSDAMREMLLDLLGSDPSLNGLADLIVERTAGNPFFIEETVHQLVESGSLQGKRGAYRLTHPVAHVAIPPTVEAVLASRIDRLGEREKALLQTASVIGREVPLAVLGRVADLPESDLAYALDELVRAEFLYEAALYPETEYAFRHPLIQDVAYRSQLAERRSRVHRAVAQSILALAPDKAQERAALLAHHWEGAGEPLEASRWHLTASAWVGRSDHAQALHHLRTGRSLLESAPSSGDAEGLLLGVLGQILYHGWRIGLPAEEATDVYSRARSLAERAGDPTTLVVIIATYAAVRALSGEIADALALSREAWEIFGKGPGHPGLALTMRVNLSYLMFILGDWPESMAILEEGVAVNPEDPTLGADLIGFSPWIWMSAVRGLLNAYMGRPERTLEMIDAALDVARRHGDMEIEGWLHGMYAAYARMTGDLEALGAHGRQAVAIAEKIGSAFSRALAYENLGQSYSVRGEWADAVAALEQALGIMRGHGVGIEQSPFVLWMLAEAYLESEDDRALQTAEEAVAEAQRLGTKALEVEALRVLARALVRERGAEAAGRARDSLERALALVKVTGGVAAEPDVRLALAELAAATGDDAARMRQLREAQRILTRMGATVRAERVATLLS